MSRYVLALFSGLLFGVGLSLSQMVNPEKVLNFLDLGGNWDPSLAFVMLGALSVTMLCFRVILKRDTPLFDSRYFLSENQDIDTKLVSGAALFGIGWGMSGYCPGPAIAGLGLFVPEAFILVLSIVVGSLTHTFLSKST